MTSLPLGHSLPFSAQTESHTAAYAYNGEINSVIEVAADDETEEISVICQVVSGSLQGSSEMEVTVVGRKKTSLVSIFLTCTAFRIT